MNVTIAEAKRSLLTNLGFYNGKPNQLSKIFGAFAKKPTVVGGGIKVDEKGEFICVYVEKELTAKQTQKAPKEHEGYRVEYETLGTVRAFKAK